MTVAQLIDLLKAEDQADIVCVETFTHPRKAGRWHLLKDVERDVFEVNGKTCHAIALIGYSRRNDKHQ